MEQTKTQERRVQVNVRLSPAALERMKAICEDAELTQSRLIELMLEGLEYTPVRVRTRLDSHR